MDLQKGGDEVVTITIWGTPEGFDEEAMVSLAKELLEVVRPYKPAEELAYVVFPADRMKWELGKEIFVEVRGPVSSANNIKRPLAEVVGETVASYFPTSYVECEVHPEQLLSPNHHWRSKRKPE